MWQRIGENWGFRFFGGKTRGLKLGVCHVWEGEREMRVDTAKTEAERTAQETRFEPAPNPRTDTLNKEE